MNDFIWDTTWTNCKIDCDGIIRATMHILKDDELFFNYGEKYNWDTVKTKLLQRAATSLKGALDIMPLTDRTKLEG
jgi:hypothetical protein